MHNPQTCINSKPCTDCEHPINNYADTWTITVELTVFAGDMDKQAVIDSAEPIIDDIIDGTDFASFNIIDARRNLDTFTGK